MEADTGSASLALARSLTALRCIERCLPDVRTCVTYCVAAGRCCASSGRWRLPSARCTSTPPSLTRRRWQLVRIASEQPALPAIAAGLQGIADFFLACLGASFNWLLIVPRPCSSPVASGARCLALSENVAPSTLSADAEAGAAAKRKRGDDMAELEAQAEQAAGAGAGAGTGGVQPGTRVRGFVSAGVIQQGNTEEQQEAVQAGGAAAGALTPSSLGAVAAGPWAEGHGQRAGGMHDKRHNSASCAAGQQEMLFAAALDKKRVHNPHGWAVPCAVTSAGRPVSSCP
jgi:hypothetical protein